MPTPAGLTARQGSSIAEPMAEKDRSQRGARRLDSARRREEILAAAGRALADQGFLPLPMEQIAREAGASKALVYVYFPKPVTLYNALLESLLTPLAARIAEIKKRAFEARAVEAALLYFDDVAEHGALIHLLLTDVFLDGARDEGGIALRDAIWRRFIRASRSYAKLPVAERVAAFAMILAIPEEMGRLAHRGELTRERARALCGQLTLSALRGVRDDGAATKSPRR